MNFILKHFDTPLLRFSATMDTSAPEIEILWQNAEQQELLPLDLHLSPEGLSSWLRHRTIPKNRANVHALLAKQGMNLNRPMGILLACKGLSLNDCYWVTTEEDSSSFEKNNLYENPFNQVIANLAFTGFGDNPRSSWRSSPEFTTNGMLRKCWRRQNGKILLYKGGTEGASNTGYEPYSEFYASQIAEVMGIDAIPYGLSRWKNTLCSTCELFTSKEKSFVPIGGIVTQGGMTAVLQYYEKLGEDFVQSFYDMLLFDAVICNTDRHFGNFGFLVETKTNRITAPAPLFDHGNSLFNLAGSDCWENEKALEQYIDTLVPCTYDGFISTARKYLNSKRREKLRRVLEIRMKRHPRYNLPQRRLKMIERQLQKRVQSLLDTH